MTWRLIGVALILSLPAVGCGGGSKDSNSPLAPSGSGGSSPASGPWTETITRPNGLGTIAVRWEAATGTVNGIQGLTGPMTLTNGAASVTLTANGVTGGNDSSGYNLHLSFTSKSGDFAAFPTCNTNGNSAGQGSDPFPSPYTSISVAAFSITYNNCRGFIDTGYSSALSGSLQETVQLSMRK